MSTLYVAEVAALGVDSAGNSVMAPRMPPIIEQTVPIGMASQASAAFSGHTQFIQLHTDSICSVAFGANPTAITSNQRLAANETRFYAVMPGQKVAVISNS